MFTVSSTTYNWIPFTGTGRTTTALEKFDDGAVRVTLPWRYNFYCADYTDVYVNSNGFITFESASGPITAHPENYPNQQPWTNGISGLWDDWNPTAAGTIYYTTIGTMAVFTWAGVRRYGAPSGNEVSFQIILRSDSPDIVVNYQDVTTNNVAYSNGRSATIGVSGKLPTEVVQYSSRINYHPVTDGSALIFRSLVGTTPLAPQADAGGPYTGFVGMAVTLDGSRAPIHRVPHSNTTGEQVTKRLLFLVTNRPTSTPNRESTKFAWSSITGSRIRNPRSPTSP